MSPTFQMRATAMPAAMSTASLRTHRRRLAQPVVARRRVAMMADAATKEGAIEYVPPGCNRYTVSLLKPLGMVLEQRNATGEIYVAELIPEGAGEKSGVGVGDTLISTSAVVKSTAQVYGETEVQGGEQRVTLNVRGESFETVMAAIGTHISSTKVKLEFQRCDPSRASFTEGEPSSS